MGFFRDCRNDIHCQTVNIFLFRILYRSGIPTIFLVYTLFINKQRICSVEAQSRVAVISTFQNSKATMLAIAWKVSKLVISCIRTRNNSVFGHCSRCGYFWIESLILVSRTYLYVCHSRILCITHVF